MTVLKCPPSVNSSDRSRMSSRCRGSKPAAARLVLERARATSGRPRRGRRSPEPNTPSDPPGRSTDADFANRTSGSSQWNALNETTASKSSPAGSHVLERRRDDLDLREGGELPPRDLREVGAQLDGEDREAALGERQRRLARAAADLEHARSRRQAEPARRDRRTPPAGATGRASSYCPRPPASNVARSRCRSGVLGHAACRITHPDR